MRTQRLIRVSICALLLASCDQWNDKTPADKQARSDERSYQAPPRRHGGGQDVVGDVAGRFG